MIALESFTSYETTKLLYQAGFDWNCQTHRFYSEDKYDDRCSEGINAPTLATAQKWLREKGLHILIYTHAPAIWEPVIMWIHDYTVLKITAERTYEQALDAGIASALKWLLNK